MKKRMAVFCICLLFPTVIVCAETTLYLKSGEITKGKLVERTDDTVKLDFYGVAMTYWMKEIETIVLDDGTKIHPASRPETTPEVQRKGSPQKKDEALTALPPTALSRRREAISPDVEPAARTLNEPQPHEEEETAQNQRTLTPEAGITAKKIADSTVIVVLFFGLLTYGFFSYCLQLIAAKTDTANAWYAWVPLLNLLLICDIADKPRWWAALFLLGIIPFLGPLAVMTINVLLFMSIAQKRKKPAWVGILMIVPLVSLLTLGYLAFAE